MMALSTSASSGLTTSSRSASVLDGAIWSSGTSSPVLGSRYCTRLWWLSWASSSTRMPVARRTSTIAQAQNASPSSAVRLRRLPVRGSSAQMLAALVAAERVRVMPGGGDGGAGAGLAGGVEQGLGVAAVPGGRAGQHRQDGKPFAGPGIHP